jgi:hypothetical protein
VVPVELRRAFVAAWIVLGVVGALNHTVFQKLFDEKFDLQLPHLKYGHVMFNRNLHQVPVYEYAGKDGARHPLADLVETPALGYQRTRLAFDVLTKQDYLMELCFRTFERRGEVLTFYADEYDVDVDPRKPARTTTFSCDANGLVPR